MIFGKTPKSTLKFFTLRSSPPSGTVAENGNGCGNGCDKNVAFFSCFALIFVLSLHREKRRKASKAYRLKEITLLIFMTTRIDKTIK